MMEVHHSRTPVHVIERGPKRIVATDSTFLVTFSLRKSGRWVRIGDRDIWGAHRLNLAGATS